MGNRQIRIRSDGTIRVGCKNFTIKGVAQVVEAAKAAKAGKKVEISTDAGDNEEAYQHDVTSEGRNYLKFDREETQSIASILKLATIREKLMAKVNTKAKVKAKTEPKPVRFAIFPVARQAQAKKKAKK